MAPLKISIPVDRRNNLAHLEVTGNFEVSTDNFDTFSQAYKHLKPQTADLLSLQTLKIRLLHISKISSGKARKECGTSCFVKKN